MQYIGNDCVVEKNLEPPVIVAYQIGRENERDFEGNERAAEEHIMSCSPITISKGLL